MCEFKKIFEQLHLTYNDSMRKQLLGYMDGVLEWNKRINLTAITERDAFIQKHYVDSLFCTSSEEFRKASNIIDVGTGGGFPGIPLAIAFPDKHFVLIDSLNKRIRIIHELSEKLGISNISVFHGRAEELARREDMREKFDLCVSRAVANMSTLAEYCLPFVRVGGSFIAYKGPDCDQELEDARKALRILGGRIERKENPVFEGILFDHKLIFVGKMKKTPSKYPRKAGTPSKEPLL